MKTILKMQGLPEGNTDLSARALIEKDQTAIKIFQHELRTLVATEKEHYIHLKPGSPLYTPVEVLPDFRPMFLQVDCGTTKQSAYFEIKLGDCADLTVLVSHTHKFPAKEGRQFEREKLLL